MTAAKKARWRNNSHIYIYIVLADRWAHNICPMHCLLALPESQNAWYSREGKALYASAWTCNIYFSLCSQLVSHRSSQCNSKLLSCNLKNSFSIKRNCLICAFFFESWWAPNNHPAEAMLTLKLLPIGGWLYMVDHLHAARMKSKWSTAIFLELGTWARTESILLLFNSFTIPWEVLF